MLCRGSLLNFERYLLSELYAKMYLGIGVLTFELAFGEIISRSDAEDQISVYGWRKF